MSDLVQAGKGAKQLLLGNEAIVRGLLEGGVDYGSSYPGTPSSEIGNTLEEMAKEAGMYFEYATNEKVAFESAASAAVSGLRSFSAMKHVGLNVAADAFMTFAYAGTKGGFVLITADDPSCHSSQNEQDNRYYSVLSNLPMLEPSTPHEAKEMVKQGFDLSEELELPVIVRTTTRINHVRGVVEFGEKKALRKKGRFEKDPSRFVTVPAIARKRHPVLLKQMEKAKQICEKSEWNHVEKLGDGDPELHIIASGAGYNYAYEEIRNLNIPALILKLGFTHPFPEDVVSTFIKDAKRVLVVEELEPYLEERISAIAKDVNSELEILGKRSGHFSRLYEYSPDVVRKALSKMDYPVKFNKNVAVSMKNIELPSRPPALCAGCPHRSTYYAVNKALKNKKIKKEDAVFSTDIGCYTLGIQPPLSTADFLLCMGSSVGTAGGFSKATDQKIFGFIGDSTFFHAGVPGLISAVYNKHDFIYVIMDNRTTAMTGHQPNPGMGRTAMGEPTVEADIEKICKGVGVEFVETVDPYDIPKLTETFEKALDHEGISVVIPKHPCALLEIRDIKKEKGKLDAYFIDPEVCKRCHLCLNTYACPAMYKGENGKDVHIDETMCVGCGTCTFVCPFGAIKKKE